MSLKAFDIIHTVNISSFLKDDPHLSPNISSLEVCGDYLYIGCKEGIIFRCHFQNVRKDTPPSTRLENFVSVNHPVTQMKGVSALNLLLVLSNETLLVLDLENLELVKHLKLKNITAFCLNENPIDGDPFNVEVCVARKKQVVYLLLSSENMKIVKEFPLTSPALSMAMDGVHLCFSVGLDYLILNVETGEFQELFGRDSSEQVPVIHRILKGEFLVNGPGGLGVFVSAQGFSERPPIHFTSQVTALTFHHPYIITISKQGIEIYSIIDQQCKQVIAVPNVHCLIHGDGQMVASTLVDIFALQAISWQVQVEKLVADGRIEEALHLATNAHISSSNKEEYQNMLQQLQQKAALKYLSAGNFSQALELYELCHANVEEVLSLNLKEMFLEEQTYSKACNFLVDFLQRWRKKDISDDQRKLVDTSLLKYYAENPEFATKLVNFIEVCSADNKETCAILEKYHHYHCLALHYIKQSDLDLAFQLWSRLMRNEVEDVLFPGCHYVTIQLTKYGDVNLIWKFASEILKKDQLAGVRIFTDLHSTLKGITPESICKYLECYPQSMRIYLEFLVNEKKLVNEYIHTQLANNYIEEMSNQDKKQTSPAHRLVVNKLRCLLRTSPCLNLNQLTRILDDPRFPHEHAIVCGRLGDHATAINIFIRQLRDFDAAEEYCACIGETAAWNSLLSVCVAQTQGEMFDRIIHLLHQRPQKFDVLYTLRHLPDGLKMDAIAPYLKFAMREILHEKRMKQVEVALSKSNNLDHCYNFLRIKNEAFTLQSSSYCYVCKKRFDPNEGIARYPNGVVTHIYCARDKSICPVTGHIFQITNH